MANISEFLINAPLGSVSANFWDYIKSDIQENLIILTHDKQRSIPGLIYYQVNNNYLGGVGRILIREVKKDISNIEHSIELNINIEKRESLIQLIMSYALDPIPKDLPNFLDKILDMLKSEKFMDLICLHNITSPCHKLGLSDLPDYVYLHRSEDPRIMNGRLTFTVSYDKSSTINEALRIIWRKDDEVLRNKFFDSFAVTIQEQKENILRMVINGFFVYLQRKGIVEENNTQRRPPQDALARVAYALYLMEIGNCKTRKGASQRAHTSVETIRKHGKNPEVITIKKHLHEDRDYANSLQKIINRKMEKKTRS